MKRFSLLVILATQLTLGAVAQTGAPYDLSLLYGNGEQDQGQWNQWTAWALGGSQCLPPNVGSQGYRNVGGAVRTLEQCIPIYADYASAVINSNLPYSYNFYWTSAIQGKFTGNYAYIWQAYSRCDEPTGPDNYAGANVTYTEWFGCVFM